MSKEKQIEEMANHLMDIQRNFDEYCAKPCRECELGGVVNCESYYKAEALYNAGYRKQSEGEWREDIIAFCNVCSSCRAMVDRYAIKCNSGKLHYCPNCGAKMKGGE